MGECENRRWENVRMGQCENGRLGELENVGSWMALQCKWWAGGGVERNGMQASTTVEGTSWLCCANGGRRWDRTCGPLASARVVCEALSSFHLMIKQCKTMEKPAIESSCDIAMSILKNRKTIFRHVTKRQRETRERT